VPSVIYTFPELARVGIGEDEAGRCGIAVRTGMFPFTAKARAKALGVVAVLVAVERLTLPISIETHRNAHHAETIAAQGESRNRVAVGLLWIALAPAHNP
jgi:hypothetical protein